MFRFSIRCTESTLRMHMYLCMYTCMYVQALGPVDGEYLRLLCRRQTVAYMRMYTYACTSHLRPLCRPLTVAADARVVCGLVQPRLERPAHLVPCVDLVTADVGLRGPPRRVPRLFGHRDKVMHMHMHMHMHMRMHMRMHMHMHLHMHMRR